MKLTEKQESMDNADDNRRKAFLLGQMKMQGTRVPEGLASWRAVDLGSGIVKGGVHFDWFHSEVHRLVIALFLLNMRD